MSRNIELLSYMYSTQKFQNQSALVHKSFPTHQQNN